jgi:mRNA interferase HicA
MKLRDLIAELERAGCVLLRNGAKHDIYHNPANGRSEPVPRHREVNELLARKILKSLVQDEKGQGESAHQRKETGEVAD